jgi:hypothetical protein
MTVASSAAANRRAANGGSRQVKVVMASGSIRLVIERWRW